MNKLSVTSSNFLKKLDYWISRGEYGVIHDDRIWIYNTLEDWAEQLGVSKSTFQRLIKKLREVGIVETAYLARNRRDRTLHYTINYERYNQKIEEQMAKRQSICKHNHAVRIHMVKITGCADKNEHMAEYMVDHMYNINNISNKIHKSYKSRGIVSKKISSEKVLVSKTQAKSLLEHNEEMVKEVITERAPKEKPNTIQRMVKSLENIFPGLIKTFRLTKAICRNLVAAFQRKFHNSIEEWEQYLKLIATSSYLNGEKFKLSIYWILKFLTIDRILNGEFGVNPDKITYTEKEQEKMEEKRKQQIQQKIADINETEICKQARIKVLDILGTDDYHKYFENQNKCRFIKNNGSITIELLGSEPWDFIYKAQKLEQIGVKTKWVNNCIKVTDEKGHEFYDNAKSFEELEKMNISRQQKEEKVQNRSLWKRIFKVNDSEIIDFGINELENSGFNLAY